MPTLLQIYRAHGESAEIRNRTTAAIAVAAWEVLAESAPDSARVAWAKDALVNAETIAGNWMWAVITSSDSLEKEGFVLDDAIIQKIVNILRDKHAV